MPSSGTLLASVPLFAGLTAAERDAIAAHGSVHAVAAGTLLIREGDRADAMFALLDGAARVLRTEEAGADVAIATLTAGDCFGEMALLDGEQRSATIVTATACRYFTMQHDAFWALIAPSPALLRKLLAQLSARMRDTSRRLARAELEARVRAAEADLRRQRTIAQAVTGLAHEMNTPLGICVSMASSLQGWLARAPAAAAELREPIGLIADNLARVVALTQTFHALAADHHAEAMASTDLRTAVEEGCWLFTAQRPEPVLTVTVTGAPSPWRGHRAALHRVLAELLANAAAHAYPAGGGPVEVALAPDRLDGRAAYRLTVRDRGAGVAPDALPRLTDPFFTTARGRGHKGLGLTIAYNAATGPLGGSFLVESAPGAGMTVTLVIPQRPPASAPAPG
ncbi:MAG TPA: cyclic nucleotide-binding domain-containing protein [Azospirillum sp.]|nr:cyclic nucleotide-binding domain-containing protein [Azospirillum sp.]